jgi:putative transposase
MILMDVREIVGDYMTAMVNADITCFPGREPYARSKRDVNHRNGSYDRNFTLKAQCFCVHIFSYGECETQ